MTSHFIINIILILHGRNDFAEIFKNLAGYGYENNFVGSK